MNKKLQIRQLFKAIESGDVNNARQMLQKNCDPSALLLPEGISAMHLVAGVENRDAYYMSILLLLYGGNTNVRSSEDGFTPLHICAAWGHVDVLRLFLKYGGDPDLRDNEGNSALDLATQYRQNDVVSILSKTTRSRPSDDLFSLDCTKIDHLSIAHISLSDDASQHNKGFCEDSSGSTITYSDSDSSSATWYTVDEFLCLDDHEKVAFIEQQCCPTAEHGDCTDTELCPVSNNHSFHSCKTSSSSSSIPESINGLGDGSLAARLKELGDKPGPITSTTRRVYLRRLKKLLHNKPAALAISSKKPAYSIPLINALNGKLVIESLQVLETKFLHDFDTPQAKNQWRGGLIKSCFNYLLIDPRISENLPIRAQSLSLNECFATFVKSIFYVGKGKNARAYDHLYEALRCSQNSKIQATKKVQYILDIWNAGLGVVSLHCFQGSITVEAFTREACILDAIGMDNLTNVKKGEYYGQATKWSTQEKCKLGVLFLNRAFHIFLHEGERQIRPLNICSRP